MSLGKFFSSKSQMNKQLASSTTATTSDPTAVSSLPSKNNAVSHVEYRFRRMAAAHDRIRTALLATRGQNPR